MIAPPPAVQWRPMRALPATPTQPAKARVRADVHVVADLHQVVELDAVFDHGVVERAAVDAGVGADLDVVADTHRAELLDLDPAPLRSARSRSRRRRSPRRRARCRARRCGSRRRSIARGISRVPAPTTAPAPTCACGRHHGAVADHGARGRHRPAHRCRPWRAMLRARLDHRAGVHARHRRRARAARPPLRQAGKGQVGVGADDGRGRAPRRRAASGCHDHAAGGAGVELRAVARVGQEADGAVVAPWPAGRCA